MPSDPAEPTKARRMNPARNPLPHDVALLLARVFLAALFLVEASAKVGAWAASQGYMQKFGVPGALLPAVVALELGAGLALLAGWRTSLASLALAAFCVAAALLFHARLSDHGQALHFWKDIAIAGGFVALSVAGAGRWSIDGMASRHPDVVR